MADRWNGIVDNCAMVRVRSTPEPIYGNVIGFARLNAIFQVLEELDEYYKINYYDKPGYILKKYLRVSNKKPKHIKKNREVPVWISRFPVSFPQ